MPANGQVQALAQRSGASRLQPVLGAFEVESATVQIPSHDQASELRNILSNVGTDFLPTPIGVESGNRNNTIGTRPV